MKVTTCLLLLFAITYVSSYSLQSRPPSTSTWTTRRKDDEKHKNMPSWWRVFPRAAAATAAICLSSFAFQMNPIHPINPANAMDSSIAEGQIPALNPSQRQYTSILSTGTPTEVSAANEKLLDHAVGTINTMYYDNSGGNNFDTRSFYYKWKALRSYGNGGQEGLEKWKKVDKRRIERERADWLDVGGGGEAEISTDTSNFPDNVFANRENAVKGLTWLVSELHDPFSKYLTKDQLLEELQQKPNGFLGLGIIVEPPQRAADTLQLPPSDATTSSSKSITALSKKLGLSRTNNTNKKRASSSELLLANSDVGNLPIVTAVIADSPAERDGIVVGDRIVAVGTDSFLGLSREDVAQRLNGERYEGIDRRKLLTVAKPMVRTEIVPNSGEEADLIKWEEQTTRDTVVGYRLSQVPLPASSKSPFQLFVPVPQYSTTSSSPNKVALDTGDTSSGVDDDGTSSSFTIAGGDAIVHYELLTPSNSFFRKSPFEKQGLKGGPVGYIRLTRFSRTATAGYVKAVEKLEAAGAASYIIDVRNNYGGVIQEAMLTASTLLRDPHTVLCYTLNSRGGFTPHDAEEYIVDRRYPGYMLSSEPASVTLDQVKKDDPEFYEDEGTSWVPPSAYASLHEQRVKRGIHRATSNDMGVKIQRPITSEMRKTSEKEIAEERKRLRSQKKVVVLVNEGTASAAEVFASSLRDNGRTVALVGAKTFGKGLIQHTFPMPDGGGLRITVAEYLTPALQHVTTVGGARYDSRTGDLVGGGIKPDIQCSGNRGIPSDVGADLCIGIALDALADAEVDETTESGEAQRLTEAGKGSGGKRRIITAGLVRDDY